MNKPIKYICQIDSGLVPELETEWTLPSPDTTEWQPSIDNDGVITVTSGVAVLGNRFILAMSGFYSLFSISNGGILTLATTGTPLGVGILIAALESPNGTIWMLIHQLDGQLLLTTETPLENKYYYPAIMISFEVTHNEDKFELHAVKPNTSMHRR